MDTIGYILYEGKSKLDGEPIVVIATLQTNNRKTGQMVQIWIMRADFDPVTISQNKMDTSICGNCPHRHSAGGACYVNLGQAPLSIFRAYKRGRYENITHHTPQQQALLFRNKKIRFGAYGDPVLIPLTIVKALARVAVKHTGYTHQWHKARFTNYNKYFMASVDNVAESIKAVENGWRYFRVTREERLQQHELQCLNEIKGISCADCGLCNGAGSHKNIVIQVHGSRAKKAKVV